MDVVAVVVRFRRQLREGVSDAIQYDARETHGTIIAYFSTMTQTGHLFQGSTTEIQARFLPRMPNGFRLRQNVGKASLGFLTRPLMIGQSERMRERSPTRAGVGSKHWGETSARTLEFTESWEI